MAEKRDYYEVLDVARDASPEEIKRSYKQIALRNHPDRNPDDETAVERFKEAAEAFEVLSTPEKRSLYDQFGHQGLQGGGRAPGFNDVGDIFSMFGDLFENFGFGGFGGGGQRRPRRGESLRTNLNIELPDAAHGCSRTLEINRRELCGTCDGSGARPGSTPERCDYCGGHGQVVQSQGFLRLQTTCPSCRGAGEIVKDKCSECAGDGRVVRQITIDVKVPAGVDTGMQLCLSNEGEPGTLGGPRGDLYVHVHVHEHPLFQREGQDLICRVPITYTQAALGTEIDVPVLEGKHSLNVPAGTQPGHVFMIRGGGMPNPRGGGRPGDLRIEIQVEVPGELSEQQESLLRELAEIEQADVLPHRKSFLEILTDWFTPDDNVGDDSESTE